MVVFARYDGGPVFLDALEGWAVETTRVAFGGTDEDVPVVPVIEFVVEWAVGGVVSAATTGAALVWLLRQRLAGER